MDFQVGQKVVCIFREGWTGINESEGEHFSIRIPGPRYGEVCIITDIELVEKSQWNNCHVYLGLHKYPRNRYNASLFRPIVEKETDISIFEEILNRPPMVTVREREPV